MYSYEDRTKAVKLLILYDLSYADTVSELGYPTKEALRVWYKEYIEYGELHRCFSKRQQFTIEQKQAAIGYYLEHGKKLARTVCQNVSGGRYWVCQGDGTALTSLITKQLLGK